MCNSCDYQPRELQKLTIFHMGIPEDGFSSFLKIKSTCMITKMEYWQYCLTNCGIRVTCMGVELLCSVKLFDSSPGGWGTEDSLTLPQQQWFAFDSRISFWTSYLLPPSEQSHFGLHNLSQQNSTQYHQCQSSEGASWLSGWLKSLSGHCF